MLNAQEMLTPALDAFLAFLSIQILEDALPRLNALTVRISAMEYALTFATLDSSSMKVFVFMVDALMVILPTPTVDALDRLKCQLVLDAMPTNSSQMVNVLDHAIMDFILTLTLADAYLAHPTA